MIPSKFVQRAENSRIEQEAQRGVSATKGFHATPFEGLSFEWTEVGEQQD
jgi:hypothetical protein